MEEYFDALEKCSLFDGVKKEELSSMLSCLGARVQSYNKSENVFAEGDRASFVGIVICGSVQITKTDYYGNRSLLATAEKSELFGEAFACADVATLPVSVDAAQKCKVMFVDCKKILTLCSNACTFHAKLVQNLLRVVARKNLILNQKIEITSKRTTRDKIMAYLMMQAKKNASDTFTIPLDRQSLADYLGVERSAMSAVIGKLCKEGYIKTDKSRFTILHD